MFIYLSKKIAIPNNTKLKCIAWNGAQGYIACGGDDGLLKVLKLEAGKDGKVKGLAAPSNLSMNQTLEGHNGQIQVVGWNEGHQKLTSSDQYGLIIVWMLYKGSWYEEMINNRNKSVVRGMAWNGDGQKICIVYEDGAVIVGSVDGNRIWGKELKNMQMSGVCWSPDSRLLLFSVASGEVHVYDGMGGFVSKVDIQCLSNVTQSTQVISLQWFSGVQQTPSSAEPEPALAIAYDNGRIQLMRNENDDEPVLLDTGLSAVCCQWNHDGRILAVAGTVSVMTAGPDKDSNVVQFYSPLGQHLRTLKVPGKQITACAWEGSSLRIALAVDSFIYFANIRPDYKWAYFAHTVVYTYPRPDRGDAAVVFWNTRAKDKNIRYVPRLYSLASCDDHCVLAVAHEEDTFSLSLCNALGTTIDTKPITIEPYFVCMTSSAVVFASKDLFSVWHFRTAQSWTHADPSSSRGKASSRRADQMYHVDDSPAGIPSADALEQRSIASQDPICCLAATEKLLVVARESGLIQRYTLPSIAITNRYSIATKPHKMEINCNSTCLSVIDATGLLQLIDLEASDDRSAVLKFERKDVWDMKWASDNPELFAMMEKTRMYIFRKLEPEEPILSAGYICSFRDLEIRAVLLDEVLREPETPSEEFLLDLEVKSLRDTRELLHKVGLKDALSFIEENPHPRLWRLLAEAALENMDSQKEESEKWYLQTSESAYVRCKDYAGIQFVKRLQNIHNAVVRRAEVAAWFGRYDQAERLYLDVDRRDLAVKLRRRLGDSFKVVQLLRSSSGGNDAEMEEAANNIADFYAEASKWDEAVQYYEKARNIDGLVKCYYALEDYHSLENLVDVMQPNDPLLETLGSMFSSVGMGKQAVEAFIKCDNISEAISTCVSLNQWHDAVELATKHNQPTQISALLSKYAQHLLDNNKIIQAIELYRKANSFLESARLLSELAIDETAKRASPLRIKKLYVLSSLLVEEHLQNVKKNSSKSGGSRLGSHSSTLLGMSGGEAEAETRVVDSAWRGAEAFHFLMLCQRQLYEGLVDAAMKTALNLRDYDDVLNPEDVYSLLALASCANRAFGTCSKAFIKLEALEELSPEIKEEYQMLALDIFTKQAPKDSRGNRAECASCETMIPDWVSVCPSCNTKFPVCIMTGRPLMDLSSAWTCATCHHRAFEKDMAMRQSCPLCHATVTD